MVEIGENTNNANDRKQKNLTFDVSVTRKTHAISCANKTVRNGSLSHLFSPLCSISFSVLHYDSFLVFADENKAVIFVNFSQPKTMFFALFRSAIFCTRTGTLFQASMDF